MRYQDKLKEHKKYGKIKLVKLRKSKMDKFTKGYYPVYRTFDDGGNPLTYVVRLPQYDMEYNTLKKAKLMASKI